MGIFEIYDNEVCFSLKYEPRKLQRRDNKLLSVMEPSIGSPVGSFYFWDIFFLHKKNFNKLYIKKILNRF